MDLRRLIAALVLLGCGDSTTQGSASDADSDTADTTTTAVDTDQPVTSTAQPTTATEPPTSVTSPVTTANPTVDPSSSSTTSDTDEPVECFQCDTFAQDCPAGQRCVPWACDGGAEWNGTRCSDIDPSPVGLGEACLSEDSPTSGRDNCERGAMCWNVDEDTLQGTCIGLCAGSAEDPTCLDACGVCNIPAEGVLNLCLVACDPIAQDCPGGDACYIVNDTFVCAPAQMAGLGGDSCEFTTDCARGYTCVNGSFIPGCEMGEGCCTPFCTVGAAGDCDELPTTVCSTIFDPESAPPCSPASAGICVTP